MGREAAEHCVITSGFTPNLKMSSSPWESAAELAALVEALKQATVFFHEAAAQVPPGVIALKDAAPTGGRQGRPEYSII